MGRREPVIEKIKEFILRLSKEFNVQNTVFFGSRTTRKSKENSDIDLIIVSKDFKKMNFIERAAKMYDFWDIDYPVDFLCYTPEEFNRLKKRISIVRQALHEGVVVKI
jgi:hypothetical protein